MSIHEPCRQIKRIVEMQQTNKMERTISRLEKFCCSVTFRHCSMVGWYFPVDFDYVSDYETEIV